MKLSKASIFSTENVILFLIITAAFLIRTWRLNTDLLFHFDQGLHALGSWQIWHDIRPKLLGHQTDVDGIFHGPFYYLLMSIPYSLSRGNPYYASLFQISLEMLSLPFLYIAIKRLFGSTTALLTLLLYSLSFGLIGYSRWLSNVTPILPLANILYFLVSYKSNRCILFLVALLSGLISQLNGAVGFTLIISLIFYYRKSFTRSSSVIFMLGLLLPAVPQLLFEIRHDFVITRAILNFFSGPKEGFVFSISPWIYNLKIYTTEIEHLISNRIYPLSLVLLLWSFYLFVSHKNRRLFIFIFTPLILLSFLKRGAIGFFLIYTFPLILAIISNGLLRLPFKITCALVAIVICINLFQFRQLLSPAQGLTPIGTANLITLQDRRNVIDWIYQRSNGQPFSTWLYVIPYNLEHPWIYPFVWYGQSKYGYLPEKTGSFSPSDLTVSSYFFAVYEPDYDKPENLNKWLEQVTSNFGPAVDRYQSNDAIVELRSWKQ